VRSFNERVATDDIMNASVTAIKLAADALAAAGAAGATAAVSQSAFTSISGLGAVPVWVKYTLSAAAVAALGASLTGTLSPAALGIPANTVIHDAVINVTAAFSGTSISALHVNIGDTGVATSMYTAVDLTTVAAAGVDLVLPYTSASQVKLAFTAVGANLSAVSAGSATLYLLCSALD
jgi:hypothetical protein